jgi:ABC-type glycerol-3-phosphate transport system permease component
MSAWWQRRTLGYFSLPFIASLPVVVLFAAAQRQINRASLVGSVKG